MIVQKVFGGVATYIGRSFAEFDGKRAFLFLLLFAFGLRLVPEVLSFPYPIGFDTVYYGWRISEGVVWFHWPEVFSSWLLYGLLIPLHNFFGTDPFVLLKLAAPLLFSFNVLGIFFFARRALDWSVKIGLVASFLFTFQLAFLRISWDLYRNLLGMGLVLFALPFFVKMDRAVDLLSFVVLSILAAFAHEYAALTLIVVSSFLVAGALLGKRKLKAVKSFFVLLPVLFLFAMNVYFRMSPVGYAAESNVIYVRDSVNPTPFGLFFLTDYLAVANSVHDYGSYFDLATHVLTLFVVLYALLLPFVVVGFFRSNVLDSWLGLLVLGSFGAMLIPFCALDLWYRWMLMLVYPFSFYAAMGISKIFNVKGKPDGTNFRSQHSWFHRISFSRRKAACLGLLTVFVGSLYVSSPLVYGRFGVFSVPGISSYFPSSMLLNTIPVQDTSDVRRVMEWLDVELSANSCVLVQEAFLSWAKLYLGKEHKIVMLTRDLSKATDLALQQDFDMIYFVWWNEDIGWYGIDVPDNFREVYSAGRISVFEYSW